MAPGKRERDALRQAQVRKQGVALKHHADAAPLGGRERIERPPTRMSPDVGASNPAGIISAVVFPDPDGPRNVRNSPFLTPRSSGCSAMLWQS